MSGQDKFKGGDKFKGIYEGYHQVMMKNELRKGIGGYELSWAGTPKSGPSFGGNQIDIAHHAKGRVIFMDIIRNATNEDGSNILSVDEISKIQQIVNHKDKMIGVPIDRLFAGVQDKIDSALQSSYGKRIIHKTYVNEILAKARGIERFIDDLKEGPGKNFAKSEIGKLCIFDFMNQYYIGRDGPLQTFLNGDKYTLKSGKVLGPITKPDFGFEDFKKDFLFNLKYYQARPDDVTRRLKNIDQYIKKKATEAIDKSDDGNENGNSMCDCIEFFNISKTCVNTPWALASLGPKKEEYRELIEKSYARYSGQNAYEICKELHDMDFESYMQYH